MEACGTVTQSCSFQNAQQLEAVSPRKQSTLFALLGSTCVLGKCTDLLTKPCGTLLCDHR